MPGLPARPALRGHPALLALVVVEQINATSGIGYMITLAAQLRPDRRHRRRPGGLRRCSGLLADGAVRLIERKALAWRRTLARADRRRRDRPSGSRKPAPQLQTRPAGVLNGLDLEIAPGEFVALLGRSGSGKSTLLRALAGLDRDVAGHGRIDVPDRVSVVFQDSRLLPWRRVLDNVTSRPARPGRARARPAGAGRGGPGRPREGLAARSCPAASSSGRRWPARWSATRSCCWPTSRSARSTR